MPLKLVETLKLYGLAERVKIKLIDVVNTLFCLKLKAQLALGC